MCNLGSWVLTEKGYRWDESVPCPNPMNPLGLSPGTGNPPLLFDPARVTKGPRGELVLAKVLLELWTD
jgi:hypothetical protein